ncbi:MAG: hypothetical protein IPK13_26200 [Deltaproteobacteria bacterium]|nr:hypothetical protein [Deltaproteobacteria bacterium]
MPLGIALIGIALSSGCGAADALEPDATGEDALSSSTTVMRNRLSTRGDGAWNAAFGQQVRNIIIYQASAWSGLPRESMDNTWPLAFGRSGYVAKTKDVFLRQNREIAGLGRHVAIAVLLMPDEESDASGFGACWNSPWIDSSAKPPCADRNAWRRPMALFPEAAWAAWMNGLSVAPMFSINNYGVAASDPSAGARVLPKLRAMLDWYRNLARGSLTMLRTDADKLVILTEGLPENTRLSETQRAEILRFMAAQTDVLWLDNLAASDANPSLAGPNIVRTAAAPMSSQAWLASVWGARYRFAYVPRWAKSQADAWRPENNMSQADRERALGINPPAPDRYPVILHQWNEYAEFLVHEPTERGGYDEYNYIRWMLSRQ